MKFKIETKVVIKRFYEVEATDKKQAVDKLFEYEDGTRHFHIGCFKPEHEDEDLCICNDLTAENNVELEILDKLTENEICVGTLSDMIIRNFKRVEVNSEQRYKN